MLSRTGGGAGPDKWAEPSFVLEFFFVTFFCFKTKESKTMTDDDYFLLWETISSCNTAQRLTRITHVYKFIACFYQN